MESLINKTGMELVSMLNAIRISAGQDEKSERYQTAERNALPIIEEMNIRAERIAKKFNKRAKKINFRTFNRPMQYGMGIR